MCQGHRVQGLEAGTGRVLHEVSDPLDFRALDLSQLVGLRASGQCTPALLIELPDDPPSLEFLGLDATTLTSASHQKKAV